MLLRNSKLTLALLAALGLSACSSDQDQQPSSSAPSQATPASEDRAATTPAEAAAVQQQTVEAWTDASLQAALSALPEGDVQRGERVQQAMMCAACHSVEGEPESRNFVNLNHQPERYLQKTLIDYRDNRRNESYGQAKIMSYLAKDLDDQQIADLAAFYASQPRPQGQPGGPEVDDHTLALVHNGDMSRMVMSCAACHGAQGEGNGDLFPALIGQQASYTIRTLKAYRDGERVNDINGMMGNIARNLTDDEIVALAKYYQHLQP